MFSGAGTGAGAASKQDGSETLLTRIQEQGGQIFVLDHGNSQLEELTWR